MEEIGVLAQEPKPMLFLSVRICFVRMNTGQLGATECKNMVMQDCDDKFHKTDVNKNHYY